MEALAVACLSVGLDDEALAAAEESFAAATPREKKHFEAQLEKLRTKIESIRKNRGAGQLAAARKSYEKVAKVVEARRTWEFESGDDAWWHDQLQELVADLEEFRGEKGRVRGVSPDSGWGVERRVDLLVRLKERIAEERPRWDAALERIRTNPIYEGFLMKPQIGLIPLGPDPDSGLEEFAEMMTGAPPSRSVEGEGLTYSEDSGIVFVLIPGGEFWLGAQKTDPKQPGYDPLASVGDDPVTRVSLAPFFISKHELTQAQWIEMEGVNPQPIPGRDAPQERRKAHETQSGREPGLAPGTGVPSTYRLPSSHRGTVGIRLPGRDDDTVVDWSRSQIPRGRGQRRGQDQRGDGGDLQSPRGVGRRSFR